MSVGNLEYAEKLQSFISDHGGKSTLKKTFYISYPNRFIYTANAKVASSTIKLTLSHNEYATKGYPSPKDLDINRAWNAPKDYPNLLTSPQELTFTQLHETFIDPALWRFTFVRDPFDRVASAYLDKVASWRKTKLLTPLLKFAPRHLQGGAWSFEEFLEVIANQEDASRNLHWRTQTASIFWGVVPHDFVGRFENLKDDFSKVLKELARRNEWRKPPVPKKLNFHSTSNTTKQSLSSEKARKLVWKIYETDYDNFNY